MQQRRAGLDPPSCYAPHQKWRVKTRPTRVVSSKKAGKIMELSYTLVLPTIYGDMLVNRFDKNQTSALLATGAACDRNKVAIAAHICGHAEPSSMMLDLGSNFGIFALACAAALKPCGGIVHAYEGQRMLSYMIGGSAVLNSIENLFVHHACVGNSNDPVAMPKFDYSRPMNFGSVEFGSQQQERLDQERQQSTEFVKQVRIDDFDFQSVYLIKIDVEGMEESVLNGCIKTLERNRPIVLIEYLKSDAESLANVFRRLDYTPYVYDGDFLCIPRGVVVPQLTITLPEYASGMKLEKLIP
jgi:FkbM family methyltransferase